MQNILVVNNDIDTMSLLKDLLERNRYQVQYTSNGGDVANLAQSFKPSIILVDVLQKELIPHLKDSPETLNIPVILMTGYAIKEKINDVKADDIIEKPFDFKLLQHKIESLIAKTH